MRIVHLLNPAECGDEGVLACAASIDQNDPDIRHNVWIIGNDADERRAWSLGISSTDRATARRTFGGGAAAGLRRLHRARSAQGGPDLVQCWSASTLRAARRVFGTHSGAPVRVAAIVRAPENDAAWGCSDTALATAREVIVTLDLATRSAVAPRVARVVDAARWHDSIRVVDPPVFPHGGPLHQDRGTLRTALGLQPADTAIGVLADPPAAGDAHRMMFAAGVLHATGHRAVWLIRRGAKQERRGVEYQRAHGRRWGMVLADLPLPELVAASDLCVVDAPGAATCGVVALSLAMSMGVPVVGFPGVFPPIVNGEAWPVVISPSASLGRIAAPIAAILENSALRQNLAAAARAWCDRVRVHDGFRATMRETWLESVNVPVAV